MNHDSERSDGRPSLSAGTGKPDRQGGRPSGRTVPGWMLRLLLVAFLLLGLGSPAPGGELDARYQHLHQLYDSLRSKTELRQERIHWENLLSALTQLLRSQPPPEPALEARIRYLLGMTWRDLYAISRHLNDLEQTCLTFEGLTQRAPQSPLVDDALYYLAECRSTQGATEEARAQLTAFFRSYPDSNRLEEARTLARGLGLEPGAADGSSGPGTREETPGVESLGGSSDGSGAGAVAGAGVGGSEAPARGRSATDESKKSADLRLQPKGNGRVPGGEPQAKAPSAYLQHVKIWTNPDYTRIILHTSVPPNPTTSFLPAGEGADVPARLRIELDQLEILPGLEQSLPREGNRLLLSQSGGLVERIWIEPLQDQRLRVELELRPLKQHTVTVFQDPPALGVDLFGELSVPPEDDDPLGTLLRGLSEASGPRMVVIDAGHGGNDPGATGPSGVKEKDVTLAIALKLRDLLSTLPGIKVMMTREYDDYVSLEERVRIANAQEADIFVSIHANASANPELRGVEIYYLDNATDAAAEKLAQRENASLQVKSTLDFILKDLTISANVEHSRRLASSVHDTLIGNLQGDYPAKTVRDLGVKTALFYVLFGAQMPSILVETAFVSNGLEEQRLADPIFQERVARALLRGIQTYVEESRALPTSTRRAGAAAGGTSP